METALPTALLVFLDHRAELKHLHAQELRLETYLREELLAVQHTGAQFQLNGNLETNLDSLPSLLLVPIFLLILERVT